MSFFYKAMEIGRVGIVSPVASATVIFTLYFTSLLFALPITKLQVLSVITILVGIILVKVDLKEVSKLFSGNDVPGLREALFHIVLMGVFMALIQIPNKTLGPVLYPFVGEFTMIFVGLGYLKIKGEKLKKPDRKTLCIIAAIGLLLTAGILILFNAIKYGNPIIVFPIYYASPPLVAIIGYFLYKERLKFRQYTAVAIIILGVILLRLGSL